MTSIADRLKDEQKRRAEQESALQRAAKSSLFGTPTRSKAYEIGRKNYNSNSIDDDDVAADGETYDIDPSVQLWKNIDFGRAHGGVLEPQKAESSGPSLPPKLAASVKNDAVESLREEWLSAASTRARGGGNSNAAQSDVSLTVGASPSVVLGSMTKGPRLNRAVVASVLEEDYGAAQQIEEMKKALARIQQEKEAAEGRAKVEIESHQRTVQSEMQKQQEELREMMESMKREKEEIRLRAALLDAEKAAMKEEAERKALTEMNRFNEALDVMKSQNLMLINRMELSQQETKTLLERERSERMVMQLEMEKENKRLTSQLIEAQIQAEKQLAAEKNELKSALQRMEAEKEDMRLRILATEERSRQEASELEAKTASFSVRMQSMENEKLQLRELVEQNELKARDATTAVAEQLLREKDELKARLERMELEKKTLAEGLANTEAAAKQQAAQLAEQLAAEKAELKENLERMEREKRELAGHLKSAELAAKEQATILAEQITKEKDALKADLDRMDAEKSALIERLAANEVQIREATDAKSDQLLKEQEDLRQKIHLLANEKSELSSQLKLAEEQALAREKVNNERLIREREELMQTVQRMKEELMMEREKSTTVPTTSSGGNGAADNPFNISPHTSLYELLEDAPTLSPVSATASVVTGSNPPRDSEKAGRLDPKAMVSHMITTIAENEEEANAEASKKSQEELLREELSGLPAPHISAAMGELSRLRGFAGIEASLLSSFDADHRTPLFYAAAYSQTDTVKYLLDLGTCDVLEADVNGDTALHAATSSGNIASIELLLGVKKAAVHKKNSMGMTPGHLAKSAACLRVLYRNGADLAATDINGRSPLFVSCAMNRVDCAEYLIDCLDLDETALLITDARGDTPLHASACNGSVDCLLLLLQHGVDPMLTNTKGLKAIDLAIRNKHVKCRELLAEYHLHFCTGSNFDSVLFLATLEGHRQVKNNVRSSGSEQYDIIKRQGGVAGVGPGAGAGAMKKARSMYSLNHNRSLRLQRWGSWIAYEDQDDPTKTYWYNQRTGDGQYEKPEKVISLQEQQEKTTEKYGADSLAVNILPKKASMRLKRVGDWIQYVTETGQTFYYNEKNGDFQWVNPIETPSISAVSASTKIDADTATQDTNESGGSGLNSFDMKSWKPFKDPESGAIFWYNSVTQVSQWECPFENDDVVNGDNEGKEEDNEAVQVVDNDDLGI